MPQLHPWLKIDNMVELGVDQHGYKGSWFLVKIKALKYTKNNRCNEVHVEYANFFESDEPGSAPLVEVVKPSVLRPLCPHREEDILRETYRQRRRQVGEAVEAQHNGAWWEGYIKETMHKENEYIVSFEHGYEDLKLPANEIRTRWKYKRMQGEGCPWQWIKC